MHLEWRWWWCKGTALWTKVRLQGQPPVDVAAAGVAQKTCKEMSSCTKFGR